MPNDIAATKPPAAPSPVAIVTGASSGIGEATARCLAKAGFRVVLAARRQDELDRLAKEIDEAGGEALAHATDLACPEETAALARATLDRFGRVDVLVNNAGYGPAGPIEQLTREQLRHAFDVNLLGALQLAAAVASPMRDQGGGRIINMGSLGGLVPAPMAVAYSATKAGLDVATRGLRLELEPFGIHVCQIVPGFVDTPTFDKSRDATVAMREDEANPYRQVMIDLDEFAQKNMKNAIPPEAIGDVVVHAATSKKPKLRYYAPASARLQTVLFSILPETWAHAILKMIY